MHTELFLQFTDLLLGEGSALLARLGRQVQLVGVRLAICKTKSTALALPGTFTLVRENRTADPKDTTCKRCCC